MREVERRELEAREAQNALAGAHAAFATFETQLAAFRRSYPDRNGDLARPDMTAFRDQLARAESLSRQGDTAALRQTAEQLREGINEHIRLMDTYPETEKRLAALPSRLEALEKHPYAQGEPGNVARVRATFANAQTAWNRADKNYGTLLASAEQSIKTSEEAATRAQKSAESAEAAKAVFKWGSLLGLLGLSLGAGGLAFSRSRSARQQAQEQLEKWDTALSAKLVELGRMDERKRDLVGDFQSSVRFEGASGEVAKSLIKNVGELWVMLTAAQGALKQAQDLVASGGRFSVKPYRQALELLRDTPIHFGKDSELESVITGKDAHSRRGSQLWGDLKDYEPFSLKFDALMKRFNAQAKATSEQIETIASAKTSFRAGVSKIEEQLPKVVPLLTRLRHSGIEAASMESELIASARKSVDLARSMASQDPLGASAQIGPWVERVELFTREFSKIADRSEVAVRERQNAAQTFSARGIQATWIETEALEISRCADGVVTELSAGLVNQSHFEDLVSRIDESRKRATRAAQIAGAGLAQAEESVAGLFDGISAAKATLSERLSLRTDRVLVEAERNPAELVSQAQSQVVHLSGFLAEGKLNEAGQALESIGSLCSRGNAIIRESLLVSEKFESEHLRISGELERLSGSRKVHVEQLRQLSQTYDAAVLLIAEGDTEHPRANGTVADNIREVDEALSSMESRLKEAQQAFQDGRVLEAAARLNSAAGAGEFADDRYLEIREKAERVETTLGENTRQHAALVERLAATEKDLQDDRTTLKTIEAVRQARRDAAVLTESVKAKGGNPFEVERRLGELFEHSQKLIVGIHKDWEWYAEASRSLTQAQRETEALKKLVEESELDGITDSRSTTEQKEEWGRIVRELQTLSRQIGTAHADWATLDKKIDALYARAASAKGALHGELKAAEKSVRAVSEARDAVHGARNWRGSYGVIIGSIGNELFRDAQEALSRGFYGEAALLAARAEREATNAINAAEAEVQAARLEAEQARKAAEAAARKEELKRTSRRDDDGWGGGSVFGGLGSTFGGGGGSSIGSITSGFGGGGGSKF